MSSSRRRDGRGVLGGGWVSRHLPWTSVSRWQLRALELEREPGDGPLQHEMQKGGIQIMDVHWIAHNVQ